VSLTTTEPRAAKFLDRFEHVRASLRRSQIVLGLCRTLLAFGLGLAALAAADHRLELPLPVRAAGLAVMALAVLAVFAARVVVPLRWWSEPRTAAEIERRFPQLGQRIRTVVQYAGLPEECIHEEGATPGLVEALEEETDVRSRPLPLGSVVPVLRVTSAAGLAALPLIVIAFAAVSDREWRTALGRALLDNRPYTTLAVAPGDVLVDQGSSVAFSVVLTGRPRRDVVLQARPAGRPNEPWTEMPMAVKDDGRKAGPASPRTATMEKVREPLAYRVVAGRVTSPTYTVDVLYPLALRAFEVGLKPPAYTGLAPATVKGGDLQAVEGTEATFRVRFDAPPAEASLVLIDPSVRPKKGEGAAPEVVALQDEGSAHTAVLSLTKGLVYSIEARTADGRVFPKNRYRIDVHEDRPPRVSFEEPDEALEVHPIAEVRHRVRAGDDFGLTRAGIVFRLNDGDERTLAVKEFGPGGKPTTAAVVEEMLLLETLAATSSDSVTYYAFAEDNHPGGPRRTETDLRYLDIRPFKREYKAADGEAGDDNGGESTTLEELIARQRFNLNRGVRLARRKPTDKAPADDPLRIATFEESLAGLVREFTGGLEGVAGERVEPLHQAEEAMLAAVEALDRGRNDEPPRHMAEALRHLIEVRRTFRILVGLGGSRARSARSFDRMQAQKIRKPKSQTEEAEQLAADLERLAQDEDFVYATLAGLLAAGGGETEDPAEDGTGDAKGEPKAGDRRGARERQEKVADEARALEEKLKRLEAASDLARARMSKAAEAADKASAALARGSNREAAEAARAGALMLHEVARQVKGEVTGEVADELAMARDLADELARREAEFGNADDGPSSPGQDGSAKGQPDSGGKGKGQTGPAGTGPDGWNGWGDWSSLTDAERLERLEEAARTLQEWLKGASKSEQGSAAERVRELVEQGPVVEVVDRAERVGALYLGGRKPAARREARELSKTLEALARQLDVLHRGIVAPELAKLVEFDRRVAELTARLKALRTDAEITEWHRLAAALVRDLEKAGLSDAASALARLLESGARRAGGEPWGWADGPDGTRTVPAGYADALAAVVRHVHERVQGLVLKDLGSARDEATPPEFRDLVDRYYEVLSGSGGRAGK
jgi:hypothetical protein